MCLMDIADRQSEVVSETLSHVNEHSITFQADTFYPLTLKLPGGSDTEFPVDFV